MWRTAKQLLHLSPPSSLISDSECASLSAARSLTTRLIASSLQFVPLLAQRPAVSHSPADFSGPPLVNFDNATSSKVLRLINKMSNKSSPRDVLPTSLLKSCSDLFAPIVAHLANLSFNQGVFPTAFKITQVLPLQRTQGWIGPFLRIIDRSPISIQSLKLLKDWSWLDLCHIFSRQETSTHCSRLTGPASRQRQRYFASWIVFTSRLTERA